MAGVAVARSAALEMGQNGRVRRVAAESRLFATLDPSSRRLRFPRDIEVIITDTVGFIKDLPNDLMVAFRATLEELEDADLLLHVIDISNPRYEAQIKSVEKILADLNLQHTATIRVLNKLDRVSPQTGTRLSRKLKGIAVSARSKETLLPLIGEMKRIVENISSPLPHKDYRKDLPHDGYRRF